MANASSLKARITVIAVTSAVGVLMAAFWLARELGALMNALAVFLFVSALILVTRRVTALARRKVSFSAYRRPRAHLSELGSILLRFATPFALACAVNVAFVPAQFDAMEAMQFRIVIWVAAAVLAFCALVPRGRPWAPSDVIFAALLLLVTHDLARGFRDAPRDGALELESPFDRPAYVFQGGGSPLLNHHAPIAQQAWAIDVVLLTSEGRIFGGDQRELSSYPCFGAALRSPVSGTVANVVGDRPDMPIGQTDREVLTGNSITIQTEDGRYVLLAHLQAGSVQVDAGQRVLMGQPLARCGNSGNTTFPHLHLQAQNRPLFSNEDPELRTFPMQFVHAERLRDGSIVSGPFAVRRNDSIIPGPAAALR